MEIKQCPVEQTMMFLEDQRKIMIISYLLQNAMEFSELQKKIGYITEESLRSKLKELEEHRIIEVIHELGKTIYTLTEFGYSFNEVIQEMILWGEKYKELSRDQ